MGGDVVRRGDAFGRLVADGQVHVAERGDVEDLPAVVPGVGLGNGREHRGDVLYGVHVVIAVVVVVERAIDIAVGKAVGCEVTRRPDDRAVGRADVAPFALPV